MRLSPRDIDAVNSHLNQFAKTVCPVCHYDEWTVSEILFALPEYEHRPLGVPFAPPSTPTPRMRGLEALGRIPFSPASTRAQVFPVVPVTCVTCGYVFLLSGIKLGIVSGST